MIVAVVVTHNRAKLLSECIHGLRSQTRRPDLIVVIGNGPTSDVRSWLDEQKDIKVFYQDNLGSAGGQRRGIQEALKLGAKWIWCMDDDTLPLPTSLERMIASPYYSSKETGFLASVVQWTDGALHKMNLMNPLFVGEWLGSILDSRSLPVASCSFVSVMFKAEAVTRVGLPISEMFIWGDDIEYTLRVSGMFKCYGVLDSVVVHQTIENVGAEIQIPETVRASIKIKCMYRNQVAIGLLSKSTLLVRLKRVTVWVLQELFRNKTWRRRCVILINAAAGIPFYFKYCRCYRKEM